MSSTVKVLLAISHCQNQALIADHKKDDKKMRGIKEWPHTMMNLELAAVPAMIRVSHSMSRFSAIMIGLTGAGKTTNLNTLLMAFSKFARGSLSEAELYQTSDLDALRDMRLTARTPLFIDDGCLKEMSVIVLKHVFGVPGTKYDDFSLIAVVKKGT